MSLKHANISIFVPHIGCPNKCSFCNQRYITGTAKAPRENDVLKAVKAAKTSPKFNPEVTEIAFFGGSFTAINRNYMLTLLKAASKAVEEGNAKGIRISTRPDAIDEEILSLLKEYKVTAIELGAQSLDNKVLKLNNRGHSVSDVVKASKLIKDYGFELGLQIMTGLFGETEESISKTAQKVIAIKPDTLRIYPTIVLKDTYLAALYSDKIYQPQSLEEAVELCSYLYEKFTSVGIRVIRLGLHSIEESAYIAGPWHPAFSELCQSRIMLNKALNMFEDKGNYKIFVNKSDVSKMIGQRKTNIEILKEKGYNCKVSPLENLNELEIEIEREV